MRKEKKLNLKKTNDYFSSKSYLGYIFSKIKKGDLFTSILAIYKKIRKYTLISVIIRTTAITISLLEKSALLLLFASFILLLLPVFISFAAFFAVTCVVKYFLWKKTVTVWLKDANKITVYLSSERIFSDPSPLFMRFAGAEASEYDHPVIVLCSDPFLSVKWYSLNLLAIRPDYFFILKKYFFEKNPSNVIYIVLS